MTETPTPVGNYYDVLAEIYDEFKAGEDLQAWAGLVLAPVQKWGTGGHRLLDVGCGTGGSSEAFANLGYQVTGCDISERMLEVARSKKSAVRYLPADVRALPAGLSDFDVINWMGDVPNHLLNENDLAAAFSSCAQALRPGGILVFDANTICAYRSLFTGQRVVERARSTFAWIGETQPPLPNSPTSARILAFHRDGADIWHRDEAVVNERHYETATVHRLLSLAGLATVATYGLHGGTLVTPADEEIHIKLIYVAKKPEVAEPEVVAHTGPSPALCPLWAEH